MLLFVLLVLGTAFLAYSNGANDNFKGVATLFGSNVAGYRQALAWATVTTFLGALASVFLAGLLVKRFSGKGLVPDAVAASPTFLLAVALGAGLTVILATWLGFPISTTHSLTGALVGSGLAAAGMQVDFGVLGRAFFLPLLVSPLMAAVLAGLGYFLVHTFRRRSAARTRAPHADHPDGPEPGDKAVAFYAGPVAGAGALAAKARAACAAWGGRRGLNAAHYASAGVVSFARGLNDTPKIVALLLVVEGLGLRQGMLIVAVAMAAGGLLNARKVAETISRKITPLKPEQGLVANLVTGMLVVGASRLGLPVSTTHVSVGSIFGIGAVTRAADRRVVSEILMSWVLTLPLAALASAGAYGLLTVC